MERTKNKIMNKNEVLIDCFMFCQEIKELSDSKYLIDRAENLSKKLEYFGIKKSNNK